MEPTNFRTPDRWNSVPVPDRVSRRAYERRTVTSDGCWLSRYSVASHGYAQIGWTQDGKTHMVLAHRAAWAHVNGQVPLGMTLDHLCKVKRCVNPAHLRVLPNYENARRVNGEDWPIGFCKRGHPSDNLVEYPRDGRLARECGICRRARIARNNWRVRYPGEPYPTAIADPLAMTSEEEAS